MLCTCAHTYILYIHNSLHTTYTWDIYTFTIHDTYMSMWVPMYMYECVHIHVVSAIADDPRPYAP